VVRPRLKSGRPCALNPKMQASAARPGLVEILVLNPGDAARPAVIAWSTKPSDEQVLEVMDRLEAAAATGDPRRLAAAVQELRREAAAPDLEPLVGLRRTPGSRRCFHRAAGHSASRPLRGVPTELDPLTPPHHQRNWLKSNPTMARSRIALRFARGSASACTHRSLKICQPMSRLVETPAENCGRPSQSSSIATNPAWSRMRICRANW
jgi:hypothetical protein